MELKLRGGARGVREPVHQPLDPHHCAADHHRERRVWGPGRREGPQGVKRRLPPGCRVPILIRGIDDVEEVVDRQRLLRGGRLVGPDVQPAVHLHAVC